MKSWEIEYYTKQSGRSPIEEFIDGLPINAKARVFKTFELVEEFGLDIGEPHVKYIKQGLWELRIRTQEGALRFLFTIKRRRAIILLHGFYKKTNKIRMRDLRSAEIRMNELE